MIKPKKRLLVPVSLEAAQGLDEMKSVWGIKGTRIAGLLLNAALMSVKETGYRVALPLRFSVLQESDPTRGVVSLPTLQRERARAKAARRQKARAA